MFVVLVQIEVPGFCCSCTGGGARAAPPPLFNVWVGVGPVGAIAAFELSEGAVRC